MNLYENLQIDLEESIFRLLKLSHGEFEGPIQCDLFNASFDKPETMIPYAALSYTWGSSEKLAKIKINNTTTQVTSNLDVALRHLRSKSADLILWIDAICINQNNVHEKIHQIRQMGDIYKRADKVIVWLGESTENTNFAMDIMRRLQSFCLNHGGDWRKFGRYWIENLPKRYSLFEETLRIGVSQLLGRPWFQRIWVLQEIANARAATIHCGKFSVSAWMFSQFPALVDNLQHSRESSIPIKIGSHCQAVLDIMPGVSRKESWWEENRSLCTLLAKFRGAKATDKRDMIYALLGISSDACDSVTLYPDYNKSLDQVILETISFILYPSTKRDASFYEFLRLGWTSSEFLKKIDTPEKLSCAIFGRTVSSGQVGVIQALLMTSGFEVNLKDDDGQIPLHRAAKRIFFNERIRRPRPRYDLHEQDKISIDERATTSISATIVDLLLNNGSNIEARNQKGETSLFLAIRSKNESVIKVLLENGANSETKNSNGDTSLLLAALKKLEKHIGPYGKGFERIVAVKRVVSLLLENGADIEAKDFHGDTPLLLAIRNYMSMETVISFLLEKGADIEAKDKMGNTPLLLAVETYRDDLVKFLLRKGANLRGPLRDPFMGVSDSRWISWAIRPSKMDEREERLPESECEMVNEEEERFDGFVEFPESEEDSDSSIESLEKWGYFSSWEEDSS